VRSKAERNQLNLTHDVKIKQEARLLQR